MTSTVPAPQRHHILDAGAIAQTADFIAGTQAADGQIPWFRGGHTDPWDHVESALALDVAGRHDQARAGYEWLRDTQNPDGSWFRAYEGDRVTDTTRESNFAAYLAVGLWHHFRTTGDAGYLESMWPTLVRALDFVLSLQQPGGQIRWAVGSDGTLAEEALLTGCASMHHSLRSALAIAGQLGVDRPDWERAATALGRAIAEHPERFSPRSRYSMDWYYPVLGGVLRGDAGRERIKAEWDRFVVPGLGCRCVSDRPWVTVAETSELVLALCALGDLDRGAELLTAVQRLRHTDGSYWTGYVYADDALWPEEQTTWTAGAVLLAASALAGTPSTLEAFGMADEPEPDLA